MHVGDSIVRSFERRVRDEAVAFTEVRFVAGDFGRCHERAEAREGLEEHLLFHHRVQVADEQLCSHTCAATQASCAFRTSCSSSIRAGFVDSDWFAPEADLVHDLDSVVGVFLGTEFDEAIALMCLRYAIFR